MLTTPAGKPASRKSDAMKRPDSGVCSAVFMTTTFPVARAGASFQASIRSGKFCNTRPNSGYVASGTPAQNLDTHPGNDLAHDANRLHPSVGEVLAINGDSRTRDFVRPARIIAEALDREVEVNAKRVSVRLAIVDSVQTG